MKKGEIITTHDGSTVEIHSMIDPYTAKVYQLDEKGKRMNRFRADGYLMGRVTIKKRKLLDL